MVPALRGEVKEGKEEGGEGGREKEEGKEEGGEGGREKEEEG